MPSILPWKLVYGLLIEVQYHFVFAPSLGVSYFTVILVVEPWLLNQACISRTSKFRQGFCLFRKGWPLPIQNNPKVGEFSVKSISSFYNFTQKLCVWGQDIVLKVCFIEVPLISPSLPKEHECSRLVYLKSFGCLWTLGPYVDPLPNIQKSRGGKCNHHCEPLGIYLGSYLKDASCKCRFLTLLRDPLLVKKAENLSGGWFARFLHCFCWTQFQPLGKRTVLWRYFSFYQLVSFLTNCRV